MSPLVSSLLSCGLFICWPPSLFVFNSGKFLLFVFFTYTNNSFSFFMSLLVLSLFTITFTTTILAVLQLWLFWYVFCYCFYCLSYTNILLCSFSLDFSLVSSSLAPPWLIFLNLPSFILSPLLYSLCSFLWSSLLLFVIILFTLTYLFGIPSRFSSHHPTW